MGYIDWDEAKAIIKKHKLSPTSGTIVYAIPKKERERIK